MEPLNILISNDDGVFAEGIRALAKSAQKKKNMAAPGRPKFFLGAPGAPRGRQVFFFCLFQG